MIAVSIARGMLLIAYYIVIRSPPTLDGPEC
jgi:hypothetical protein